MGTGRTMGTWAHNGDAARLGRTMGTQLEYREDSQKPFIGNFLKSSDLDVFM